MTMTIATAWVQTDENGEYKHGAVHAHYNARYGQVFCDVDHAAHGDA